MRRHIKRFAVRASGPITSALERRQAADMTPSSCHSHPATLRIRHRSLSRQCLLCLLRLVRSGSSLFSSSVRICAVRTPSDRSPNRPSLPAPHHCPHSAKLVPYTRKSPCTPRRSSRPSLHSIRLLPASSTRPLFSGSCTSPSPPRYHSPSLLSLLLNRTFYDPPSPPLPSPQPSPPPLPAPNSLKPAQDRKETHSISTKTSFGSLATSTQLLAGLLSPKYSAYSLLNGTKSFIDLRKTVVLRTWAGDELDAASTAETLARTCFCDKSAVCGVYFRQVFPSRSGVILVV